MPDSFSEVSSQSWFSRIGDSIKGIVVGVLLFLGAFVLLFWNEGRAVQTYKSLTEVQDAMVAISPESVDPSQEGKPVYLTGKAETGAVLADDEFGVSANALKLKRDVAMYQWKEKSTKEKRKKLGGGEETITTYTYDKVWSDKTIDSASFKHPESHENPRRKPFESTQYVADPVMLGAHKLSKSLIDKIDHYIPLVVDAKTPLSEEMKKKAKVENGRFYIGEDSAKPAIGDVQVTFKVANATDVSLVARQVANTFEAFQTKAGDTVDLLEIGVVPQHEMFTRAHQRNEMMTWILRGGGFLLMFSGLALVLKPFSVLADVVPLFGSIVGFGTALIALLVSVALSLVTIAMAWLFYRPLLGGTLLLVAGAVLALIVVMLKRKRPSILATK